MKIFFKRKHKDAILRTFKAAGIYREYESYNRNTVRVFPRVHSIREFDNRLEYVFTLLDGMDPKEIRKKEYVFKQVFGENVDIQGDLKKFVLNVYKNKIPKQLTYNLATITENINGGLPIAVGIDQNGEYISYDMVQHPHLLIAGETGSGKSTQVRSILTTLINTLSSNQLHLHLADLKRTEFHLFRKIDHVKSVSTRVHELEKVLKNIKKEIENRGDLLDKEGVAHVDDLKIKIPYIILCVDEVAMLKKEKDIMEIIEEISALGIYLIMSMQRPDAKVLDGKLKVNLTVRMGFRSADRINSNIIGTPGAEDIKTSGRMIFKNEELTEIQAPYLSIERARKLLEPYRVEKVIDDFIDETEKDEAIILGVIDDE